MEIRQKKLNLLGLAQRARQLVSGDELVEKAIKKGSVSLVICASDTSVKTQERYTSLCEREDVVLITSFDSIEISHAIGKSRSICAITNRGMSDKFLSYETRDEEIYDKK